jgi:hypothetical protein
MTQTTTTEPLAHAPGPHPLGLLMTLIVSLLTPMFICVAGGDIALARAAAIETINGYRAETHSDLIAIAQIVAFGLAALGSLSLSLADDVSVSMAMRLRGNANACNRSAEQNRRALASRPHPEPRQTEPRQPEPRQAEPDEPDSFLTTSIDELLAAESQSRLDHPAETTVVIVPRPIPPVATLAATRTPAEKCHQGMWAIALINEASEINASLPNLPPSDRHAESMRAAELGSRAHGLLYGEPPATNPAPQ